MTENTAAYTIIIRSGFRKDQRKPRAVPLYLSLRSFWVSSSIRSRCWTSLRSSPGKLRGLRAPSTIVDISRACSSAAMILAGSGRGSASGTEAVSLDQRRWPPKGGLGTAAGSGAMGRSRLDRPGLGGQETDRRETRDGAEHQKQAAA